MTTGATQAPADPVHMLTTTTGAVQTASGSDVLMSSVFANTAGVAHRIYCCTTGNLAIKRVNDSAFVIYPVFQGQYLDGQIIAVAGTGNGTGSGMSWIPEV